MRNEKYYDLVHKWLGYNFNYPIKCGHCKVAGKKLEFALIKGRKHEKKRENYVALCVKCHKTYDGIIERLTKLKYKPVMAIKDNQKYRFDSIKSASISLGIVHTAISNALNGRSSSAAGYKWKFI